MPIARLPDELRSRVVAAIRSLPNVDVAAMRRAYLHGALDNLGLPGMTEFAPVDILNTIQYLDKIGTLEDGRWPVLVLLQHVAELVPPGALGAQVRQLERDVAAHYSERSSPPLAAALPANVELEALVGLDDRLPFSFLERACQIARSVGLLLVHPRSGPPSAGTAWLLTPRHIITNWHVVSCLQPGLAEGAMRELAQTASVRFDFLDDVRVGEATTGLGWVTGDEQLDFAILALREPTSGRTPLRIQRSPALKGHRLNIAQHPLAGPLSFAIRENDFVASPSPALIHYLCDTEPGASGAPVCNDHWEVVALHHASRAVNVQINGRVYSTHNEGILMGPILEKLTPELRASLTEAPQR